MAPKFLAKTLEELGLISLWDSSVDTKLLCCQRFVRLFAYGGSTLILVAYLNHLNISKAAIGLFMTLTLVGDVVISFLLTLLADALGRKAILALGAFLMVGSGIVFALSQNYYLLLAAAILGVISPSGNEIGPFRAIEESTLAQLTPAMNRGDIYAWYSLIGTAGQAFGLLFSGAVIQYLRNDLQWDTSKVYKAIFWGYSVLGMVKVFLSLALSTAVEMKRTVVPLTASETAPLIPDMIGEEEGGVRNKAKFWSMLPDISVESRPVVLNLCLLFGLDAFASGLAPISWAVWYFHDRFNLEEGKLGSLFFVTSIIAAISVLLASSIAKRFGNVKTMVFTHLPSSIFLALIPIPESLSLAMLFLILRSCTQSMDTAPRTAFVAAVVRPHERTAVMGLFNITKTSTMTLGPLITGILANKKLFWVAFVIAGTAKATYDLGMLAVFAGHTSTEDREEEQRGVQEEEDCGESEIPHRG